MAPLDLSSLGHTGGLLVSVALGFAFGLILERAGFGNARKLAAQFHLHGQAVLKVMFTAIVKAMVLIFWTTGLGWLDFERVWVDPTHVWRAIIGGLLRGVRNVYVLGGGIHQWLDVYGQGAGKPLSSSRPVALRYEFNAALGPVTQPLIPTPGTLRAWSSRRR
jgi:hypothetical protein